MWRAWPGATLAASGRLIDSAPPLVGMWKQAWKWSWNRHRVKVTAWTPAARNAESISAASNPRGLDCPVQHIECFEKVIGAKNRFRIGSGILGTGVAPLVETAADQHALGTAVVSINRRQKAIDQRRRRLLGRAPILGAKL